jgi:hypothetical protein
MNAVATGLKLVGAALALCLIVGACSGVNGDNSARKSPTTRTTAAPYDGTAYASQVQTAILDNFGLTAFVQACPQPDWVCAIGSIDSPRAGAIDVVLQSDWELALPDSSWNGPPAGLGCAKWGERIGRNVANFAEAAHIDRPRVAVFKHDGSRC